MLLSLQERHLKEEGMMNKAIAIDMGVSFSIFSKLLSGKRPLTEGYVTKLFTCFNREHYAVYAPKLTACICEAFQIPQTSMLYIKMKSKSYEDLLRYLFFELRPEDIETAADLKELFCARLRSTLAGLLEKQCPECDGYRLIPDEHLKVQTHIPQLAPACVFVAGRLKCGQWSDKICILVVPYDWNNEHKILSDPFILDNFIHCMVVRLRKTQPKPICTVDVDGEIAGTTAEFETIYIDRISCGARKLAKDIFERLCRNITE